MKIFILIYLASIFSWSEVKLKTPTPKPIYQQCTDCHRKKNFESIPKEYQPKRNHENLSLKHGNKEISCNFCHDKNNFNLLMQTEEKSTFLGPSGTCKQCHVEEYEDWSKGIHGKRSGGWKGERVQFHCIECHNPHSVTFPKMKAQPAPPKPSLGIPKHE